MKKIVIVFVFLLLTITALACLSACSQQQDPTQPDGPGSQPVPVSSQEMPLPSGGQTEPPEVSTRESVPPETAGPSETGGLLADYVFDNRIGGRWANLAETDLAYYGTSFGGSYLYFYDKQSGESGVFCNKPECMHKNVSCGAYVGQIRNNSLSAWQGRLWFISAISEDPSRPARFGLWSIAEDGSDRRFHLELVEEEYATQFYLLHQGQFFGMADWQMVENGMPVLRTVLYKVSLETGEKEILFLKEDGFDATYNVKIAGDYVYFLLYGVDGDGRSCNEVWRCNWKTKETQPLLQDGESGRCRDEMAIGSDGSLYLTSWSSTLPDGTKKAQLYRLEANELTVLPDFDLEGYNGWHLSDNVAVALHPQRQEDGSYSACVKDFSGRTLYEGILSMPSELKLDPAKPTVMQLLWGDADSLIFDLQTFSSGSNYYLIRFDITKEAAEGEILWGMKN